MYTCVGSFFNQNLKNVEKHKVVTVASLDEKQPQFRRKLQSLCQHYLKKID